MAKPIPQFDYGDTVYAAVSATAGCAHADWRVCKFVVDTIEMPSIVFGMTPDPILYNGIEADLVYKNEWEAQLECHKRSPEKKVVIEAILPGRCLDCDMLDDTMLCRAAGRFAESDAEERRATFCPMQESRRIISENTYELLMQLQKQMADEA